ncbi:unnamed protein product [Pocillopora meandrina]|uniref:VWFA domain-containing protein n=1 Tax=Pocillopora meandrina TaxID=46732 RepID=A0AAU9XZ51_9CNID|nr:unnamed protein product [Pocillopora meandrina]
MANFGNRSNALEEVELSITSKEVLVAIDEEPVPTAVAVDEDQVEEEISAGFEPEDEHGGIDASTQQLQREETEEDLDNALRKGDFDAINQTLTPKTLARCKTNSLLKSLQVNKALRDLIHGANPEKDDIEQLEKSIGEFAAALIDPLKADDDTRNTFQSCFDDVVDKAIDTKQKKFIFHPVVYNLLNSRWYRSFFHVRKESWRTPKRWGYFFLNLWTVFDIFFFPFLFAIFFVVHLVKRALSRKRETEICFVLTLGKDTSEEEFNLVKGTINYIVREYGCHSAKYCVVLHKDHERIGNINFKERCTTEAALRVRINALELPSSASSLVEDLVATQSVFMDQTLGKEAKKVVVLFLNYSLHKVMADTERPPPLVEEIQGMQVNIFPVGIGENAKLSELNKMASKGSTARHFGEYESPETLGTAVIQEKYKDYFTTPYFIFFRDTLSYLTLLGLHFAICLFPSSVAFSQLEWAILVFFLGRVVMEVDQFISAKEAGMKAQKLWRRNRGGSSYQVRSHEGHQETNEAEEDNILRKKLSNYFSDRWNVLDFIILVFYLITFILRIITLRNSTDVSDNRILAVSEYFYGFIAMFLTLRAFGQVIEGVRGVGAIQIALFFVIWDVMAIFWQFLAIILAFSLAMTKIYVAEKASTLGKDSAEDLACSDSGLICWWNMATHLGWSLLGLADLDRLNSVDNPSVSLVHVLYSLFLILAVVLLVNMMIALLSNTYQQVQDNSLQEWSFKRAITVRTYSTYHPIPVPFNLLSVPLIILWNLCWRDTPASREGGRRVALNKVVKKLERMYFGKYGYEFPLTEGKKIDHLVQENEGGRKLANQIVRQVFRPRGNKEEKLASGHRAWYDSPGIAVDGCLLTYMGPNFCNICKSGNRKNIHSAKFKSPFTPETPRFEVLIQETGERRIAALGAVHESYDCHKMPGWESGTVGYHVDDGKIFETGFHELGREVEGAMAYRGDLIACEVDFSGVLEGKVSVLFSLNGREVVRSSVGYAEGNKLFPFVSLGSEGITVLTKMCHPDRDQFSRVTNEDLQKEIGDLRRDFQDQLDKQRRMLMSEMRDLVLRLKEVKDKEEHEEDTKRLDGGKQRRFSSPQ